MEFPCQSTRALLTRAFEDAFGAGGDVRVSFAPGRVNLLGAHMDYNGGVVFPVAVPRGTYSMGRLRDDRKVRLLSVDRTPLFEGELTDLSFAEQDGWANYPKGVLAGLEQLDQGPGLDLCFAGDIPIGAGLSSSASIEICCAWMATRLRGQKLGRSTLVELALEAERSFVGVPCGRMDQTASALAQEGSLLRLDCQGGCMDYLPLADDVCFAVADSGTSRRLAAGRLAERVAECSEAIEGLRQIDPGLTHLANVTQEDLEAAEGRLRPEVMRRVRHVHTEMERCRAAGPLLEEGDMEAFGRLISASHASSRDLYEVSAEALNELQEAAVEVDGVLGARLTGAGFAGCVGVLMRRGAEEEFAAHVSRRYEERFGFRPAVLFFEAAGGARDLD